MKKIMFNDRYGLTEAVLSGCKTMTRRIIPPIEIEWARRGKVTLPVSGLRDGWLYMDCRQFLPDSTPFDYIAPRKYQSAYIVGEDVAVAQRYWDLRNDDAFYEALAKADPTFPIECIKGEKGCHNKMFVRADWMPHRIHFAALRAERLQDITDRECLCEGVERWLDGYIVTGIMERNGKNNVCFDTPREAFATLIDRISGKGTWERNPWVYAYTFELVR